MCQLQNKTNNPSFQIERDNTDSKRRVKITPLGKFVTYVKIENKKLHVRDVRQIQISYLTLQKE